MLTANAIAEKDSYHRLAATNREVFMYSEKALIMPLLFGS